jgi:cytidine deaminase
MLNQQDNELLEQARTIIKKRFRQDWHHVGAALRTRSGKTFAAVHLEANVGRIAVCAEAIALGMAAAEGDTDIETIVAVNRRGEVVDPCGMCRELISDYSPEATVIIPSDKGEIVMAISTLLPHKYVR